MTPTPEPMTLEQIFAIGKEQGLKCRLGGNPNIDMAFARAIEAAVMAKVDAIDTSKERVEKGSANRHVDVEQFEYLDTKNHILEQAMKSVMARLTELLDEDQFAEIEQIVLSAGVTP